MAMTIPEISALTGRSTSAIRRLITTHHLTGRKEGNPDKPSLFVWLVDGEPEEIKTIVDASLRPGRATGPRKSRKAGKVDIAGLKERLYSSVELAKMLGVSESTVWKFAKDKKLGMRGPKGFLYSRAEVETYAKHFAPQEAPAATNGNGNGSPSSGDNAALLRRLDRIETRIRESLEASARLTGQISELRELWRKFDS